MATSSPIKRRLAFFGNPAMARWLHLFCWMSGVLLLAFCALLLLLRFVVLPQVNHYRGDLERQLSSALHLPVTIGDIEGRMQGIRPRLELRQLAIQDSAGRPALSFDSVVGVVSWVSLIKWSPHFHRLEIAAPTLSVRRDASGHFFVAGLPVNTDRSGPDLSAWVLDQHAVAIRDAKVTWSDELRAAPPLTLEHVDLQLEKTVVGNHRIGLTAQPPAALASKLDLRGAFDGDSINDIEHWQSELYVNVDYADLAGFHPWIDYPVEVNSGRGALRAWVDFNGLRPLAVTADVSLADVQVRLAADLPLLPLRHLNGRMALRLPEGGFELTTKQLSLATSDGINMMPTDLHVARDAGGGDFSVNKLDFQALSALAWHLPLPEALRHQLADYAPRGSLEKFAARWRGRQWPFSQYSVKGNFNNLSVASVGKQPGASGLSGSIDGDEGAGTLLLASKNATVSLPAVFHQPLGFDALDAQVRWRHVGKQAMLDLTQIKFRNADAEGTASGTYEFHDKGMGEIDLDAKLSRAEGAAVWRYMPLQAGADVAPFLHAGLTQGKVSGATLKLKGDLEKFPFRDRSGTFRIHGAFHDAALRYAEGWPQLDGVSGDIDFDGPAMTVTSKEASIMGVRITTAKAVIPDLETFDEILLVEGKVAGATTGFLKFIEASPVGAQIDHFTEDMTAVGNGELDLKLTLPLRRIAQSKVVGSYRFDANRLLLDPDMPPLDEVRGHLDFGTDSLMAKGMTGTMSGLPFKLDLKTQTDGSVLADVSGDASVAQLRKQFSSPLLKGIAGSAHWSGTVRARKKSAEVRFASDLVGVSSSLPEPFNKSAKEAMPLLFERKLADPKLLGKKLPRDRAVRQITELTLGRGLHAQLVYRQEADRSHFERGLVSVGDVAARLPEKGLAVVVFQQRLDADRWRALFDDGTVKPAKSAIAAAAPTPSPDELTPNRIDLRAGELQVMGRLFHDVKLAATRPDVAWQADIASRELAAKLEWSDGDSPKLSGRISRLALPDAPPASPAAKISSDSLNALPNLDLTLDHLALSGRDYGELHLTAENKGGDWNAAYTVRNDDGVLEGKGKWTPAGAASETQADFKLHARSLERFLNRIGYPNTVKRGNADLNGKLSWKGAPQDFDVSSLNGQLTLEANNGQFNKLEPGVGRLLGILSLQSIPRRITLDFRDIFSEGLAFDTIKGQVAVTNGVLDTQNMEIRGPAARIQMAGNVDLNKETQDLKVRVQPTLSDAGATGLLFVHPAVGAGAWVFNKLFGNPLDNAFAYDMGVTGSWADPKVEKLAAQAGAAVKGGADK